MNTLSLEIITPDNVAYMDTQVTSLNVPSETGQLGILPHHTPLFARLIEGEVKIVKGNEEIYLAIGGGFIEVFKNKVTVLVTRAVHEKELSEKEVIEAQKRAQEILKEKPSGEVLIEAQNLYRRSLIDLKVLRRKNRPRLVRPESSGE